VAVKVGRIKPNSLIVKKANGNDMRSKQDTSFIALCLFGEKCAHFSIKKIYSVEIISQSNNKAGQG
jgi:hypothetical protein